MMNIKETKRFLKKIGKSGKYLFRPRKYGVDDGVFCLQRTPYHTWILTYMDRGKIASEYYFIYPETACLCIRNHALENYTIGENSRLDAYVTEQKEIVEKEMEKRRFDSVQTKLSLAKNSRLWLSGAVLEKSDNSNFNYEQLNNEILYTHSLLSKLNELKYFSLVSDSKSKDQTLGIVYEKFSNVYFLVYFDRNQIIQTYFFASVQDAYLYMRLQAFTVFANIQKVYLDRWEKDIVEGKAWVDFLFHTNWKEMPYGYDSLSKGRLIKFLGDLKYGHNENMPESLSSNSGYSFNKKGFMRFEATAKGKTKRFYFSRSAKRYLFAEEYGKHIPEYFRECGSKKAVWLHIYKKEFNEFAAFNQSHFQDSIKHITESYIRENVSEAKFWDVVWNPNIKEVIEKDENLWEQTYLADVKLERYGNLYGSYVSICNTPFKTLSLAPAYEIEEYHILELQAEILVITYKILPAFGQPGGATVYVLPEPISELMRKGVLKLIR